MLAGEPARQWEWHESFRDLAKNQFRTSYNDMTHFREVHVRNEYPAGYGGHVPSLRHDVLFRNTAFDRNLHLRRADPSRDAHPSFEMQIAGLPTSTAFPQGAKKNPNLGVVPHDGTTTMPKTPWGLQTGSALPLNQRTIPATMRRNSSAPSLVSAGAMRMSEPRTPNAGSPGAERLRRSVNMANREARGGHIPSEAEILAAERFMDDQQGYMR